MKVILVKRLESSFHAFRKTIARFVESYINFIDMFNKGTIYISKTVFARNLLNYIDESKAFPYLHGNYIKHSFADHVKQYRRIGAYTDPNGERIDVLIVHLKWKTALEHARTRQRNFVAWYLNGGRGGILRDAAPVAFVSPDLDDWRFSYVRMEYKEEVTKSGKVKGKEELTPAKRYSFLVGKNEPNHTAQQQLLPLLKGEFSLSEEKPTQQKLFGDPEPEQLSLKGTGYKTVVPKKYIANFTHKGEFAIEHDTAKEERTKSYKYQLDESIGKNARLLDEKPKNIKICDPAIGSGAFPVGMMHEIVKGPECACNLFVIARSGGAKQSHFTSVILSDSGESQSRSAYNFKRHRIQESIYGADIDPGAIEIAKLRLWLSFVVDEENYLDIKPLLNLDREIMIKPLPNLDYKIMQGNSLTELLSTELLVSSIDHRRTELVEELKKAKDELFNITIPAKKENKRHEIDIVMKKCFKYDRDKQIKSLNDAILAVKSQRRLFEDDKDKKEDEKKTRVTEDLYLLAILNSPLCKWMIASEAATRSGGFLEYKPMYVGKIPIFSASEIQKATIVKRIKTILKNPDGPDMPNLEAEINTLICDLYDLTAEGIVILCLLN